MADKRSSITAQIRADASGWKKGCDMARAETKRFKSDIEGMKIDGPSQDGFRKQFGRTATEIGSKIGLIKEAFSMVMAPAEANVWYQDLIDSLAVVAGSAESAQEQMGRLQAISDRQRLSDESLAIIVEYNKHLQTLGYNAEDSIKFISELSNAAENFGGDVSMFSGVISALSKVGQTGNDSAKTLMRMSESAPEIRKVLEAGFGTGMAGKLDKMDLSARNLFDGIMIGLRSIENSSVNIASLEGIVSQQQRTRQAMGADDAKNRGMAAMQARRVQESEEATTIAREKLLAQSKQEAETKAQIEAFNAENLKMTKAVEAENKKAIEERKQREAQAAAELKKNLDERAQQMREINTLAEEQQMRFAVDTEADPKKKAALEAELEIMQRINSIRGSGNEVNYEIAQAIRDQVLAGKEYEAQVNKIKDAEEVRAKNDEAFARAKEKREQAIKQYSDEVSDLRVQSLRQRGKNKKADQLEDRIARDRLMDQGVPGAAAEDIVRSRRRLKEDQDLGIGRRKIRTKESPLAGIIPAPIKRQENVVAQPVQGQQNQGIGADASDKILAKLNEIANNTKPLPSAVQSGVRK